jgi:diaminopimelate decarboxylase
VHVESADELDALQAMTEYATGKARVTLRVNPDVEVDTHHHIRTGHDEAKFGIPVGQAKELLGRMANGDYPGLEPVGVHVHVGSQLPDPDGMVAAARVALEVIQSGREAGLKLTKLDVGGGLPLDYEGGEATPPEDFAAALAPVVEGKEVELQLEPGRAIVGRAGALVTQVLYRKHRSAGRMLVVDTGMQHLMRPALYEAKHRFVALEAGEAAGPTELVGPVCESTDVLGVSDTLPDLEPGDLIAILDAGAYGMTMASNYNSHPRPPEIVVEGGIARVTRRRETWEEQLAWETTGGDQGTVLPTRAMRQQMRVDDTAEFKAVDTADLERLGMPKH